MLKLKIVTPNGVLLEGSYDFVVASGDDGEIGILPNHIPIIMKISKGFIRVKENDERVYISIVNGVFEQLNNEINVVAQDGHIGSSYKDAESKRLENLEHRTDENKRMLVDFVETEKELLKTITEMSKYKV